MRSDRSVAVFGWTVIAMSETANFLGLLMPDMLEVRKTTDPAERRELRANVFRGSVMGLVVSVGSSLVVRSWLPLVAGGATIGLAVFHYDRAFKTPLCGR